MTIDLEGLVAFIREFGFPIAVLLGLGWAGAKKVWVWGRELEAAMALAGSWEKRADTWQSIALKALDVGEKVADVATAPEAKK